MATQSTSTFVGVGSSNEPTIVDVIETTRNKDIWQHYDLCKMSDRSKKGRCKQCGATSREGGSFAYEADRVRQQLAGFVIQQGLPFNHFDNPRLTNIIQKCLQPRYTHVSRATLRRDALKMWKKAKLELINGFEKLNTSVNLTTDVWSAPHGLPAPSSSPMSSNTSIFHTLRQESVKQSRSDNTGTNEFGRYAGTDWIISMEQEEFNAFDILAWWKGRQSQFPVLSIMARDLLSVQASTDHLDAQERIQHISNLEGDCLEIEEQLLVVEAEAGYAINIADEEINLEEQVMSGSEMKMNLTQLCHLDQMNDDNNILARCISIWKSHPLGKPNEVWSSDAVLQDQQGNRVHATIKGKYISKF
nr:replication protein A 70 kDa DNA-binding subunit B [Tanacetum cinerariifolium]